MPRKYVVCIKYFGIFLWLVGIVLLTIWLGGWAFIPLILMIVGEVLETSAKDAIVIIDKADGGKYHGA